MENDKGIRLLYLYKQLTHGKGIRKQEAADRFGVNERSIQRDIDLLRAFFVDQDPPMEIQYNPKLRCYQLVSMEPMFLDCGEMLAVCKILLESRSLPSEEMGTILDKLLVSCVSPADKKIIAGILANEKFYYIGPRHNQKLAPRIWILGQAIQNRNVIRVRYHTQTGKEKKRILQPAGLLFSEFYFYLAAYIEGIDRSEHFENTDDPFPTIYRIDRITSLDVLERHFTVPYSQRFSEGEFRKRVQFMYGGKLQTVRFAYCGPSVEAVLDRLPTAEILSEKDGEYEIRAEVFGKGIEMWLRSQGNYVSSVVYQNSY